MQQLRLILLPVPSFHQVCFLLKWSRSYMYHNAKFSTATVIQGDETGRCRKRGKGWSHTVRRRVKIHCREDFFTVEKIVWKEQRDGETTELIEYHPVDVELPYPHGEVTATIDIWSFGVVLYSLVTFCCTSRRWDLYDTTAMKDLCEWNETNRAKKLKLINHLLADQLLLKMLSPKPSDRYHFMELLLSGNYFDA